VLRAVVDTPEDQLFVRSNGPKFPAPVLVAFPRPQGTGSEFNRNVLTGFCREAVTAPPTHLEPV